MNEQYKKFLEGLTKLTLETGIAIDGCGCCGSPTAYKLQPKHRKGEYACSNGGTSLSYITWTLE